MNYRSCSLLINTTATIPKLSAPITTNPLQKLDQHFPNTTITNIRIKQSVIKSIQIQTYVYATKNEPVINMTYILNLLTSPVSAITINQDPKLILEITIKSYHTLLSPAKHVLPKNTILEFQWY